MRIQNRYRAKPWVRPWMFWALIYPYRLLMNIAHLHRHTVEDVKDDLYEWRFSQRGAAAEQEE